MFFVKDIMNERWYIMKKWSLLLLAFLCSNVLTAFETIDRKDRAYYEKTGYIIWEVKTDQKKIALTFDDGPDQNSTSEILDLLEQYGAKATFFVVGNKVKNNPELLRREYNEGHEIGNHTYKHLHMNRQVSLDAIQEEIEQTGNEIMNITGQYPTLFRPPGGVYTENSVQLVKQLGYKTILWSWHQDTNDWRHPGTQKIINKVLTNARNGDIVLMHDFNPGTKQTVNALKIILPALIERGFELVTVSELMNSAETELLFPDELK